MNQFDLNWSRDRYVEKAKSVKVTLVALKHDHRPGSYLCLLLQEISLEIKGILKAKNRKNISMLRFLELNMAWGRVEGLTKAYTLKSQQERAQSGFPLVLVFSRARKKRFL